MKASCIPRACISLTSIFPSTFWPGVEGQLSLSSQEVVSTCTYLRNRSLTLLIMISFLFHGLSTEN